MDAICERCGARVTGWACDLCGGTQFTAAQTSPAPPGAVTGSGAAHRPDESLLAPAPPSHATPPQRVPASPRRGMVIGAVVGGAVVLGVIGWQVRAGLTASSVTGAAAAAEGDPASMAACDVSDATIVASRTAPDGIDSAQRVIGYAADNMIDGDPSTAWRAPGTGVGETIVLEFSQPCRLSSVRLLNGYQKTDPIDNTDRWKQNRRVSKLEIRAGAGATVADLDISTKRWQVVDVGTSGVSQISLQILGSAPAKSARDYIAISEIRTG